jgi:hypothetical protein
MKQLNFTERAAQCVTAGTVLRRTTTELYDLYSHTEDMSLFIQIVGDDRNDIPDIYIGDVILKDLRYTLSQLNTKALNNCIVWLRAYDGRPLQEFAVVCDAPHNDFEVNNCNFRLCEFAERNDDISIPLDDILVIHEEEVAEIYYKIMNIINNNNK